MKRFYCTVCKKVKRVRRWPALLDNVESIDPQLRVGACNRHTDSQIIRNVSITRKVAR